MGIDPGSRVTGYGVISAQGHRIECVAYGAIAGRAHGSFPDRLKTIHGELQLLLERYSPAALVVESVFHAINARSALILGHARGVILLAAAQSGTELYEYSPLEVKKAVVGYGRADKNQIQLMVRRLLSLKQDPRPHDAADALAIALCHVFRNHTRRLLLPRPLNHNRP